MANHSASRRTSIWRILSSARMRAVLSLGILLGFGAVGTSAYWTDQATVNIGPINSGSLDLVLSPTSALPNVVADPGFATVGQGGVWTFPVAQIDDVLPGESIALDLFIHNGGTTPLKFTGTAKSSSDAFSTKLLISTTPGGSAGVPTGTREGGNRKGSCVGGSANWWTKQAISITPSAITPSNNPVTLQKGVSQKVCLLVEFDPSASNLLQNANTTVIATLAAVQLP